MSKNDPRFSKRFPTTLREWAEAPIHVEGASGGRTLEIMDFQVMQDWEEPLMRKMAEAVGRPGGKILEVGYGLGICAACIQEFDPGLHVVIECNHEVTALARRELCKEVDDGRVLVIDGFWETVVQSVQFRSIASGGFDGIVYDAFPLRKELLRRDQMEFFSSAAALLRPGGLFTYFSNEMRCISASHREAINTFFPNAQVTTEIVPVNVATDCEYWSVNEILHVAIRQRR